MESALSITNDMASGLSIQLLGPLALARNGIPIDLPSSKKLRALMAYLVLATRPARREALCDLLWDVPNDPRGELRWCLSKLRHAIDEPGLNRVETHGDMVGLQLDGCRVDAMEVSNAASSGLDTLDLVELKRLVSHFGGIFLEGGEVDRSPHFDSWLTSQRRRYQALHVALLDQLVGRLPEGSDDIQTHLEAWVSLSPFDSRAHLLLLGNLSRRGQIRACEEHVAATARLFKSEDFDFSHVNEAWQNIKQNRHLHPATVKPLHVAGREPLGSDSTTSGARRVSLAVMPFLELGAAGAHRGGLGDGLTHDIITSLAKLREFFVIARGSVYALAEHGAGPEEAGRRLHVDYVASGAVRQRSQTIMVSVELVDVPTARIVWSDTFERRLDDTFIVLDEVRNSIVSSISSEVEAVERNLAMLKAPASLNAWEAYHRGLWHMYRFTRAENDQAQHFFELATKLDPTFSRAHAGLSFTHWQSAFQQWGDRAREVDLAFDSATRSLLIDDHSPAAHWAMGRALWMRGANDESLQELERAVDLSPNFALGHYALSFVRSQSGDPLAAIGSADQSRHLSPFDPLLFGMLGARAMAHVRLGQYEEAAEWALKAAARPNSHVIILAIAANCLGLAGRIEEGRVFAGRIRQTLPSYSATDFFASFRFEPDAEARFRHGARLIGLE